MGRRHYLLTAMCLLLAFGAYFGWMSYQADQTKWISAKVVAAMTTGMQMVVPTLPRIEVHDTGTGSVYYAPDLHSPQHAFDLYGAVLVALNQDGSTPPLKVMELSSTNEYQAFDTTVQTRATVVFPLLGVIDKSIVVQSSVQVPHYQNPH